jgi:hypothetical protein
VTKKAAHGKAECMTRKLFAQPAAVIAPMSCNSAVDVDIVSKLRDSTVEDICQIYFSSRDRRITIFLRSRHLPTP